MASQLSLRNCLALDLTLFEQIPPHGRRPSPRYTSPQLLVRSPRHLTTNFLSRSGTRQPTRKTSSKSRRRTLLAGFSQAPVSPSGSTPVGTSTITTELLRVLFPWFGKLTCTLSPMLKCLSDALVGGGWSRDVISVRK